MTYLNRSVHTLACKVGLITSENTLHSEMARLGVPRRDWPQMNEGATLAAVHYYSHNESGDELALIVVGDLSHKTGIEIACILAHEVVHVWQHHCNLINEPNPFASKEFSAYGIQWLLESVLTEYRKQMKL